MHVKFTAIVNHPKSEHSTKFLALGKVFPGSDFLQIMDMPDPSNGQEKRLTYDAEWLGILASTSYLQSISPNEVLLPSPASPNYRFDFRLSEHIVQEIIKTLGGKGKLVVAKDSFTVADFQSPQTTDRVNSQTTKFLEIIASIQAVVDKWLKETTLPNQSLEPLPLPNAPKNFGNKDNNNNLNDNNNNLNNKNNNSENSNTTTTTADVNNISTHHSNETTTKNPEEISLDG